MEELIYTATPIKQYNTLIILLSTLVTLLGLLFLLQTRKIKKIQSTYRQIGLLLGGLLALILFATSLFSIWNLQTIQPVSVYESYFESYHGKTAYKQIRRAGIYNDKQQSFVNAQITIREDNILVIEKKDKSVLLFSEDNYDIKKLIVEIKASMGKNLKN